MHDPLKVPPRARPKKIDTFLCLLVLGGVHKNRKDQILVMQGWRAESNKTWKTPLGITSPRTRSMLK